jgi:hypothetical protein
MQRSFWSTGSHFFLPVIYIRWLLNLTSGDWGFDILDGMYASRVCVRKEGNYLGGYVVENPLHLSDSIITVLFTRVGEIYVNVSRKLFKRQCYARYVTLRYARKLKS